MGNIADGECEWQTETAKDERFGVRSRDRAIGMPDDPPRFFENGEGLFGARSFDVKPAGQAYGVVFRRAALVVNKEHED